MSDIIPNSLVLLLTCIDDWHVLECIGAGLHKDGHEAQLDSMFLQEVVFVFVSQRYDVAGLETKTRQYVNIS